MPQVIIRHPRLDLEYEISTADFRRGKHFRPADGGEPQTYEDAGFRIVSLADGSEYTPPAERSHAPADEPIAMPRDMPATGPRG